MSTIYFEAQIPDISYPVYFAKAANLIKKFEKLDYSNYYIIFDKNTHQHAIKYGIKAKVIEVPCGENAKSLKTAEIVYKELAYTRLSRRSSLIIGIGGGAICDLTGYVAMTFMRGIPYALIPTTLVAMTDAAIGAKVAVNSPDGSKNLIGGFYPPIFVQIDLETLRTLPQRVYISAFGEIIKIACIADDNGDFFNYLEKNTENLIKRSINELSYVIEKSIEIKIKYVEPDLTELNLDRLLNLGHSVAHSIESVMNYSLLHGECVTIGITQAARLGLKRGKNSHSYVNRLVNLIKSFGLPTNFPENFLFSKFQKEIETIRSIRDGDLREVIPVSPGKSIILHHIQVNELSDI